MHYKINDEINELPLGEDEGTVLFDSVSGNTHILDEVAQKILDAFKTESDLEKVIDLMLRSYEGDREAITRDVRSFTETLAERRILLPLDT